MSLSQDIVIATSAWNFNEDPVPWEEWAETNDWRPGTLILDLMDTIGQGKVRILVRSFRGVGNCFPNGTCTGCLGTLVRNESDLIFGHSQVMPDDAAMVDHMWAMGQHKLIIMALKEGFVGKKDVFVHDSAVLFMIALLMLIVTVSLSCLLLCKKSTKRNTFLWYFDTITLQGNNELWPGSNGLSKIIMVLGLFASLLCYNIYTAQLASQIALRENEELTLETMGDLGFKMLLGEGQFKGIKTGINYVARALRHNNHFKKILSKQFAQGIDDFVLDDAETAVKHLLYGDDPNVFMLARAPFSLGYVPSSQMDRVASSVISSEDSDFNQKVSLPMTRDPAKRRLLLSMLLRLAETGFLNRIKQVFLYQTPKQQSHTSSEFKPAELLNVNSAFVFLAIGWFGAVAVLLAEFLHFRCFHAPPFQKRSQRSSKKRYKITKSCGDDECPCRLHK